MKRHFYIIALILPILLFSCKSAGQIAKTNFDSDVIQTVKNMNTRQKIGQVLMVNFRYCKASEYFGPKTNLTDFEEQENKQRNKTIRQINDKIFYYKYSPYYSLKLSTKAFFYYNQKWCILASIYKFMVHYTIFSFW